jgi:hypothetical protein
VETSNVLNVAVGRAERRLFVLGSHAEWSGQRYFAGPGAEPPRASVASSVGALAVFSMAASAGMVVGLVLGGRHRAGNACRTARGAPRPG